jgi:hypothetical protein
MLNLPISEHILILQKASAYAQYISEFNISLISAFCNLYSPYARTVSCANIMLNIGSKDVNFTVAGYIHFYVYEAFLFIVFFLSIVITNYSIYSKYSIYSIYLIQ